MRLKTITFCLVVGLLCQGYLIAAGPMMHVVLAKKWIDKNEQYSKEQEAAFIIGTLYPDIRYIAKIPRNATHFKKQTISDIKNIKDPFEKGMRFHSYVDEVREKFVLKSKIYDQLKDSPRYHQGLLVKLAEDEILSKQYSWMAVVGYLATIHKKELTQNTNQDVVYQWHRLLMTYFTLAPLSLISAAEDSNRHLFKIKKEQVPHFKKRLEYLIKDKKFNQYVKNLMSMISQKHI